MTKDLLEATEEALDWMAMVEERIPGVGPLLQQKRQEMLDHITEVFQPFTDLADGKITLEQFTEIMERRQAEELAAREAMWGEPDDEGEWEVDCTEPDCTRSDEPLVFDELPPLYPTHEDVDGMSCVEEDEEDDDGEEEG